VLEQARTDASWRDGLGLPRPSVRLSEAIDAMGRVVSAAAPLAEGTNFDALLAVAADDRHAAGLDGVVRRVLLAMLEQRRTRQPMPADGRR
jgi:hypothetical protein